MEAIVEYSYQANEPDELEIRKGDVIKDIKVMPGGWWEGTLRDKRGMFPDNFVKVIEPSPTGNGHSSKNEVKVNNGTMKKEDIQLRNGSSGKKYCKVLFSYDPCNEDELSLLPEDTIEFLEEVEEGWWRGKLRGRIGVFPSNFVTSPSPEEAERPSASIDREIKDLCRVLFSYEAQNEDELTLNEGEIVTIISRDVADKGWWKGEIRGKVGLFPDNFVEPIKQKSDIEHWLETSSSQSSKTSSNVVKHHGGVHTGGSSSSSNSRISEKAHARKRLDLRSSSSSSSAHVSSITDNTLLIKKTSESATSTISSSSSSISSSQLISPGDLKSIITGGSSLKRIFDKTNENRVELIDNLNEAGLNEELDGVERGEGAPLSHLTASRAKAPRRRLPSSQHVRGQMINNNNNLLSSNLTEQKHVDDNLTNGSVDTVDQFHGNSSAAGEDNSDATVLKTRRKTTAPWMEELKLNQMEKRKSVVVGNDKPDVVKKERSHPRPPLPELPPKLLVHDELGGVELRQKNHNKEFNVNKNESSNVSPTGTTPAYVPYKLYSQLLERVTMLEEKHNVLQRTVALLTEQLGANKI